MDSLTPAEFARLTSVSRETVERLQVYADLLIKWQARINLVGPATIPDLWRRHMLDSAQLAPLLPGGPVLDLGSGAGFPGLVLAIMTGLPVHLVESDGRKCAFLREAIRLTGASASVHNRRIEALAPLVPAPLVVTARALAPLDRLLEMAAPFLGGATECLFLKGRGGEEELTQAAKGWTMTVERRASQADPSGLIIHLRGVHRGRDE
ncbi:MAG TPA: 16S rRNA (guanine(527)-N(7))-methyltransferase RsmG [Rhodospirillaceae bacterium]|nr:16S rRNA (guanine(527)-N(7))-methyltransferase RsmG [Rhodospirillaceae bacterium]